MVATGSFRNHLTGHAPLVSLVRMCLPGRISASGLEASKEIFFLEAQLTCAARRTSPASPFCRPALPANRYSCFQLTMGTAESCQTCPVLAFSGTGIGRIFTPWDGMGLSGSLSLHTMLQVSVVVCDDTAIAHGWFSQHVFPWVSVKMSAETA